METGGYWNIGSRGVHFGLLVMSGNIMKNNGQIVMCGSPEAAPQPAEPSQEPSDDIDIKDVREYLDAWGCLAHPGVVALLARYGHPVEPEGWQLVPKEATEQMLIDAMEASLLGRPSPDDDSYVRSIVAAWCEAAPKFGEEE